MDFSLLFLSARQSCDRNLHTNQEEKGINCIYIIAVVNRQKHVNYSFVLLGFNGFSLLERSPCL
jgi:hypothetical protein